MENFRVNYSKKGQLKVQQMAFVLVALIIFFAMVSLFYFSVRLNTLKDDVEDIREGEIIETVQKISGTAEFAFTAAGDCASCIDLDKVLILKDKVSYEGFWKNIALAKVVRIYPSFGDGEIECSKENYPNCNTITIIGEKEDFISHSSFVSLCRYDDSEGYICELGKVIMAFEPIE